MLAGPAYAHGDMAGPAELGPPLVVSAALAVISYWIVMLWPRRPETDDGRDRGRGDDRRGGGGRPKDRPINGNGVRLKVVKLKTEDRDKVLTGGPHEPEGIDHEERYATHFISGDLHRSGSAAGIRPR
jgi:hypothetical protein